MSKKKKKKLYELTPEHRAQLEPWAKKWIANALRTSEYTPDQIASCKTAMRGLYRAANLEPPPREIFCAGPISAALAASIASGVWWLREHPEKHEGLFDRALTEEDIQAAMHLAVEVCSGIRRLKVVPVTRAATHAATAIATYDATSDATYAATRAATHAATDISPVARFLVGCSANWNRFWDGGNHWSGWASYLSFFRHVAKLDLDYSEWAHYEAAAEIGPRFMHKHFWIVSEYPDFIRRDDAGRPHAERGPFCRWRDGRELFYWHGVQVPREWIEHPEQLDAKTALTWANIEQRRAAAEIIGWARVLEAVGARVVDEDSDPQIGTLLEADLPDSPKERFLKVRCGTGRTFCLPVPREWEGRKIETALAANAWSFDVDPLLLKMKEVRT